VVTDGPSHVVGGIGQDCRGLIDQPPGFGVVGNSWPAHESTSTISEDAVGHNRISCSPVLEVEAAEFNADHQHHCVWAHRGKCVCGSKGIKRPVTAHEADVGAGDVYWQAEMPAELEINARGGETGA